MIDTLLLSKRWVIRRRMAITAFAAGLLFPVLVAVADAENAKNLKDLAPSFYAFVTLIITWYTTAVTVEDNWGRVPKESVGNGDKID